MRAGDHVWFRIGGTDDYPIFRPAFIVRMDDPSLVNLRVLLDPQDHIRAPLDLQIFAKDTERGSKFFEYAERGSRVGQFWCAEDFGAPSHRRYTLNVTGSRS